MDGIHLTLKFVGDTPAASVDAVKEALQEAARGHHAVALTVQGLGCFPTFERPRVLWLGVGGDMHRLRALQADVEKYIAPLGFPTEDRGFSPHLTLARTAQGASRAEAAALGTLAKERDPGRKVAAWQAVSVSLMRSHLRPDGAVYERVAEAPLPTADFEQG
jgi:2'-5' RNA ligase